MARWGGVGAQRSQKVRQLVLVGIVVCRDLGMNARLCGPKAARVMVLQSWSQHSLERQCQQQRTAAAAPRNPGAGSCTQRCKRTLRSCAPHSSHTHPCRPAPRWPSLPLQHRRRRLPPRRPQGPPPPPPWHRQSSRRLAMEQQTACCQSTMCQDQQAVRPMVSSQHLNIEKAARAANGAAHVTAAAVVPHM